jgi:14-3-3 protein epsilon
MSSIEEAIYLARVAEQSERYEDMVQFLQILGTKESDLSSDERNLLSVAYKNAVGTRRSACRAISAIGQNPKYTKFADANEKYRTRIESEISAMCAEIVDLVDNKLIPKTSEVEAQVFYHKMKGDYFRYLAEVAKGDVRKTAGEKALKCYTDAVSRSDSLKAAHPIKVGLALNFSVFHYEVMSDHKTAIELGKKVFDEAINDLDNLDEDQYKDSASIMQLLRDNLTLWTTEVDEESRKATKEPESNNEVIDL